MKKLLTLDAAAEQLGVPKGSLMVAAEKHGFLIRVGRAIRLDPDELPALVAACKVPAKEDPPAPRRTRPLGPDDIVTLRYTKAAMQTANALKKTKRKPSIE